MRPRTERFARLYVAAVILVGTAALAHAFLTLYREPPPHQWLVLAGLTLLSGSLTVKLPTIPVTISVSDFFVFTSVLLFGPAAGVVTTALDGLIISLWRHRHRRIGQLLFNMTAPAFSLYFAAHLFFYLANVPAPIHDPSVMGNLLLPLAAFGLVYFLTNSWLVTFAVAFHKSLSPLKLWREDFLWLSLNSFGGISFAAILAILSPDLRLGTLGIIIPLLLISYLTFRTSIGRVEDATQHLEQLNRLHLSTIETLAMAIDAKDQITHGHIRRVQMMAVSLANAIGVKDSNQIKAIEAAALLHDMGKLAVPEYILNKPGKLTAAEFEKMKLHATVGADILSSIEFPYPVVPIVRHHHESWDGTGYPSGLKGIDIPIGARILAVVDCFDALTSDRPYRPKLADRDALKIVLERRGTMYDPLVVDGFVHAYKTIIPGAADVELNTHAALSAITDSRQPGTPAAASGLENIAASRQEMLALYDLASSLTAHTTFADSAETVTTHVRRLLTASLCVVYVYDPHRDDLRAAYASGENASAVLDLRVPLGHRLSGWVAANRQSIVNSDPLLDFGELARAFKHRLRSSLSTPILSGDRLIGVLTVYAEPSHAFSDDHQRIIEAVARQAAPTFAAALAAESLPASMSPDVKTSNDSPGGEGRTDSRHRRSQDNKGSVH